MNTRVQNEIRLRQSLEIERAGRLASWQQGGQPGPFKLMYFPTNACNLNCAICWQRRGVHDFSELSAERQADLIREAIELGIRELVVGGGGEPLLRWKMLCPLFEQTTKAGVYGMFFTNGTLITPEIASALVGMGWNKVLVSLDGLASVNDEIRGEGSFNQIMQGLDCLLAARGDRPLPVIGIGCVMTRNGARQLPELVQFLSDRGCDQLNLIRLVVHVSEQRRFAVPEAEMGEFQNNLRAAFQAAVRGGMATNLHEYMDQDLLSELESFQHVLLSGRTQSGAHDSFWDALCFEPFSNIVIHANGTAGPCCMSGDYPAVDVANSTLADVWHGSEFTGLRKGIVSRHPEPYCRICDINVFAENQRLRTLGSENIYDFRR